jgi:hypothetical protein
MSASVAVVVVVVTVWTIPRRSEPMWTFMPKYHRLSFLVWLIPVFVLAGGRP